MPAQEPVNRLKATSLRLFIVSIVATAIVGAGALMMPTEGWFFELQVKILLTTSILTGASVCGLICGGCYALGHRRVPTAGMAFVAIATLTGLLGVWAEVNSEWFWKSCAVTTTLGIGCSHLAMLLLLRLHRSYQWMHGLAYFLILGLASYISLLIVFEIDEELASFQLIGVMSIAATTVSLIIPVLSYLSRHKDDEEGETAAALRERIGRLRTELAELETRLEQLPPAAPASPWDAHANEEANRGTETNADRSAVKTG